MGFKMQDISMGWEEVSNDEAIRYYKQTQQNMTTSQPDERWYRKWIGPFGMTDKSDVSRELLKADMGVDTIIYDVSGYIIIPRSALQ